MKKILVVLFALGLLGIASCSKNDPGIQPPATFGQSTTPFATIILGKNTFNISETITFGATVQNTGSYSWDFGDGSSPSTAAAPTHAYLAKGVYTVKLTVYSSDKGHKYTASVIVIIGNRYFDSAVLVQIPPADSNGNAWCTSLANPYVGFNFQKVVGGTPQIASMNFVQFDPQKIWDIQYKDAAAAHIITPEAWNFYLVLSQDQSLTNLSLMKSWTRDMSKETSYPIILRGSQPGHSYQIKVYWSVGN
jgi:hypothetical protein